MTRRLAEQIPVAQPANYRVIQLSLWDTLPVAEEEQAPAPRSKPPIPNPEARPQSARQRPFGYYRIIAEPEPPTPSPEPGSETPQLEPRATIAALAFERAFRRMFTRRPLPLFHVEYRAFAGLRSAICFRDDRAHVLLSDLLADAPPLVIEALAEILLAPIFRGRASREARECYMAWNMSPAVSSRVDEVRRARGRKRLLPAQGRYFDLQSIFDELNQRFFQGQLAVARIGWSPTRSRTLLGHHDPSHRTITISRWFDSASVPRYLVDYLVYHEMLHIKYPTERDGDRRVVHSPAFREAEKKFPCYEEACEELKKMSGEEVW